ncbi:hypothetical protein ACJJTC_004246 [Scirpophaga incertulas]
MAQKSPLRGSEVVGINYQRLLLHAEAPSDDFCRTKEAAFTYAITSAGVTHALGAACARGDLPSCSCGGGRRRASAAEQWEWGGCGGGGPSGGDAAWGARFARRFLDARELEADARALMNLHNNRVGRKVSEVTHCIRFMGQPPNTSPSATTKSQHLVISRPGQQCERC